MACIWSLSAVPSGIYRGSWAVPLLRINRPHRGSYPVCQAGCSLRNNLLCVWIMYSPPRLSKREWRILQQPETCSSTLKHSNQTQPPSWWCSQCTLLKVVQEAGDADLYKEPVPLPQIPFHTSWFLPPCASAMFLVPTGLRGASCCSDIIFPF